MTQSTKFQCLNFLVYIVWVSLKAVITKKTLKEERTDKKYSNDNYNLSIVTPLTSQT